MVGCSVSRSDLHSLLSKAQSMHLAPKGVGYAVPAPFVECECVLSSQLLLGRLGLLGVSVPGHLGCCGCRILPVCQLQLATCFCLLFKFVSFFFFFKERQGMPIFWFIPQKPPVAGAEARTLKLDVSFWSFPPLGVCWGTWGWQVGHAWRPGTAVQDTWVFIAMTEAHPCLPL